MTNVRRSFFVPCLAASAAATLLACSGSDDPVPFPIGPVAETPEYTAELEEYGIDPHEYVGTEGDPELAGDADYPRPSSVWPDELVFADEGDPGAPDEPELEDVLDDAEIVEGVGTSSARFLAGNPTTWWSKTYPLPYKIVNDPRNKVGKRICRGSPYNCPVPNPHADANRFHPKAARDAFYRSPRAEADRKRFDSSGWSVPVGTTLYEGGGGVLGKANATGASEVKVNFGVLREMRIAGGAKETFLYGWAVATESSGTVSGWIRKADFDAKPGSELDRGTRKATPPRRPTGAKKEAWHVRPASSLGPCTASTYDADPNKNCLSRFDEEKSKKGPGRFSELKVIPKESGKNGKVGDYLLRTHSIINLAYATPRLGGPSLDSRDVGSGIRFERAMSTDPKRRTLLAVPLFEKNGTKAVGRMLFAFGSFDGDTFGWIALDAIRKGNPPPPRDFDCTGKIDGLHCLGGDARGAYRCAGGAFTGDLPTCSKDSEACTSAPGAATLACGPR